MARKVSRKLAREVSGKLANWRGADRRNLIAQLRAAVHPKGEPQRRLFDELLRRMELKENGTSKYPVVGIEAVEAAGIMGRTWTGSDDSSVYKPMSLLNTQIKEASSQMLLRPGASITKPPYRIEVQKDPPSKKYSEPCIGLILADAADWFVGDVLKGVLQMTKGRYDLIVEVSAYSQKAEAKMIRRLSERVSGLLIVPVGDHVLTTAITPLEENPCVLIDRYFSNMPDIPCVHPADRIAGRFAALHLKKLGCERVLVVDQGPRANTPFSITPLKERQEGCLEADEELDVRLLPQAGTDEEGGFEALKHFEAKDGPIRKTDGIFALADHVAIGCHSYLRQHRKNLTVPVLSVEGQRFGDFTEPSLLSIKFGNFEMGRLAAEILIAKIEGKPIPSGVTLPHTEIAPRLLTPVAGSTRREETPILID